MSRNSYKVLEISSLNPRAGDDMVRDILIRQVGHFVSVGNFVSEGLKACIFADHYFWPLVLKGQRHI
jgi:hypothetical protein